MREEEMNKRFAREYKRRLRLVLKSKLNGKNKNNAINTWAVSVLIMRYGAGIIRWTKEELRSLENSLGWYVKNSLDVLLQGVRATSVIRSEETVSIDKFKTLDSWNEKKYMDNL